MLVGIGGGLLFVVVLIFFVVRMRGDTSVGGRAEAFFTIDDGKTWFTDNADKIPPFEKDGKQAVLAHVYRAADGTKFVNYVERFTPDGKRALEVATKPDPTRKGPAEPGAVQSAFVSGREVKRPGDAKWVSSANVREAGQVMAIKCPNGGTQATRVEP
jgi:hypothetical protein